jgi:hypothetical protein
MLGEPIQKGWSVELQFKSFTDCFKANASLAIQLHRVGKNATKSAAHQTDKVSP